ncbi:MAG: hypothetical protein LBQ00_04330 [Syntrophobacterales bacterium]|jgi:hypothetical protein|nr:hypothetical protein [Syntrophobacterales bacterium]
MLALESKTGAKQPERASFHESDEPLSAEEIETYVGHYATLIGLVRVTGE